CLIFFSLQVFEFLIRLHSTEGSVDEEVYPHIRTLLHFDTREFLNVLALTFEDFKNDKQAVEYQQRIVDILLKVSLTHSNFYILAQVLEFLCSPDDDSRHSERQQVLLELLQAGGIVQFEESRLIQMAEKAEFYQICEFMYERELRYDKIIGCYLRDPVRKEEVFNYIHNILSMPGYSAEEKQSVWDKALEHIKELLQLSPCKAADLVAIHFSEQIESIITNLQDQFLLFQFLRSLLDPREGINQDLIHLPPSITEQFIELLCQYSPDEVLETLKVLECCRLEETIQITQKHQLHEASSYLLEKKGDIHGAFLVMLERLQSSEQLPLLENIEDTLMKTIALCQRNSHNLNQQQQEALWFPLLEAMMSPQKLSGSSQYPLKSLTMQVLNNMAAFIALPSILQRILQDPVYGKGKLGEIQGLVLGMLDTFNYEQTLLETTTNLLNHDLHWSLCNLRASVTRGLTPKQDYCCICLQQYKRRQETADEIIVFSCGHLYHSLCLLSKECGVVTKGLMRWMCYKCNSSNKGGKLSENFSELKKGSATSLAQTGSESVLDPQQIQAFDQLCRLNRGTSRVRTTRFPSRSQLVRGILRVARPLIRTGSVGFGFSLGFHSVLAI
uniref:VPS8 subunit of CORVET complex n=1 Tax=Anas zonorhyncha TaxID=75864 RepID=A0A8B9ZZD2_9AVES